MRPLIESDFSEFKWLLFGIGAIALLALRAIAFGNNYLGPATFLITASLVLMIVALIMSARERT
jgi:hypothetical protein